MGFILATLIVLLMIGSLVLIVFGLPGTWVIIGLTGAWAFFAGGAQFTWGFFLPMLGLAAFGEIAEFFAGHYGAKRYGGTNQGSFAGIVGAIVGSILGAPFFFGLGALPGSLLGAFTACFMVERGRGMPSREAARASWGVTLGRFGGFVVKMGVGIALIVLSAPALYASL